MQNGKDGEETDDKKKDKKKKPKKKEHKLPPKPDFYFAACNDEQPVKIETPYKNTVDSNYSNHVLDLFHPKV